MLIERYSNSEGAEGGRNIVTKISFWKVYKRFCLHRAENSVRLPVGIIGDFFLSKQYSSNKYLAHTFKLLIKKIIRDTKILE